MTANPYTVRVYLDDGVRIKHILALDELEKQYTLTDTLWSGGSQWTGDWLLCPREVVVDVAKYNTRLFRGVVYDIHTSWGIKPITQFIQLTNLNGHDLQRLYAFRERAHRDAFSDYIAERHGFTVDGDWAVAPNKDADAAAEAHAKAIGVSSIFKLIENVEEPEKLGGSERV